MEKILERITVEDIKNFYNNQNKVAMNGLHWNHGIYVPAGIYGDKIGHKDFKSYKKYNYYIQGLDEKLNQNALKKLMELIIGYDQLGDKEKTNALLSIFNRNVTVKKVDNLVLRKDYDDVVFFGYRCYWEYTKFNGFAIDATKLMPEMCEYICYKHNQFLEMQKKVESKGIYKDYKQELDILEKY